MKLGRGSWRGKKKREENRKGHATRIRERDRVYVKISELEPEQWHSKLTTMGMTINDTPGPIRASTLRSRSPDFSIIATRNPQPATTIPNR